MDATNLMLTQPHRPTMILVPLPHLAHCEQYQPTHLHNHHLTSTQKPTPRSFNSSSVLRRLKVRLRTTRKFITDSSEVANLREAAGNSAAVFELVRNCDAAAVGIEVGPTSAREVPVDPVTHCFQGIGRSGRCEERFRRLLGDYRRVLDGWNSEEGQFGNLSQVHGTNSIWVNASVTV